MVQTLSESAGLVRAGHHNDGQWREHEQYRQLAAKTCRKR